MFLFKSKKLKSILRDHGYEMHEYDFLKIDYDEKFDLEAKPVRLKNAHIKCRLKFIKAIYYTTNEPTHIVVDNTNIELEDFAEYILLAKSTSRLLWIHEMAPVDVKERDPKTKKNRLFR